MQLEAQVGGQPLANRFVLVGRVVVQDDVQGELAPERAVEAPPAFQELTVLLSRCPQHGDSNRPGHQGSEGLGGYRRSAAAEDARRSPAAGPGPLLRPRTVRRT